MHKIKYGSMGLAGRRPIPESLRWRGASISAIWTSALLVLLFLCSGAAAQTPYPYPDECYNPGQTYQFNTICNDSWEYKWTATDGTFVGGIDYECNVNWTAPAIGSETKNETLYVLVYNNVTVDQLFESCISMAELNVTVCPLANITVRKFYDINGDGNWDPDEPPLDNWEMTLYNSSDCTGDPIDAKLTVDGGYCNFTGLLPGEYSVKETLKPGWEVTYPDTVCQNMTLASGDNAKIFFGNRGNLSISGVKFYDPQATGVVAGKDRLGGWNITLSIWNETESYWEKLASTTTSSDEPDLGEYSFDELIPGLYRVCEELQDGWEQTYPDPDTDGGCHVVDLREEPESKTDADFGNRGALCIDGWKINAITDESLDGWNITLKNETGVEIASRITGEDGIKGHYEFCGLIPGSYIINETDVQGWDLSDIVVEGAVSVQFSSDGASWHDTFEEGDSFANVTIASGDNAIVTFENTKKGNILVHKFYDINGNGIQEPEEPSLSGWNMSLYSGPDCTGTPIDGPVPTDEKGNVTFDDLMPGVYSVKETLQSGWVVTTPAGLPSECHSVTLGAGNELAIFFGNRGNLSISGVKFYDPDDTGDKTGKDLLGDWNITLSKWNETNWEKLETKVTSAEEATLGQYSFDHLMPGLYRVCETLKDGWEQTWPDTSDGCYEFDLTGENAVSKTEADFGNRGNLSISGVKFYDPDDTGDKTGKDLLGDWNITLSKWNETNWEKLETKVTSAEEATLGQYSFDHLMPGLYRVCETLKDGWEQTWPDTSDGCYEFDLTGENAVSKTEADFGNRGNLSISGVKFYDPDDTGDKTGKDLLGDWNITLSKWNETNWEKLETKVTSAEEATLGQYSFDHLMPGLYRVCETLKDGWEQTWPDTSDGCYEFDLTGENAVSKTEADFGNRGNLSISGVKFYDPDDTGDKTGKDLLGDWNITLSKWNETNWEKLETKVTSAEEATLGQYSFDHLMPGLYRVCETLKDGWEQTWPDTSDGCYEVDLTGESPKDKSDADFGNRGNLEIDPCKFNDLDGDGVWDWDDGELGIPGWNITVTGSDDYEETLPTREGGCVLFEHLLPGEYTVSEEMRDDWTPTTTTSETFTLSSENSPYYIEFGNYQPSGFEVRKIALNKTVKRSEEITYLIQIKTNFATLNNVTVKDIFNREIEFVSASPMPDADGIWRLGDVLVSGLPLDEDDPDWRTLITLVVKVPDKQDFEYDMAQGVAGEGFVNVKNDYSTTYQAYVITNCIYVTLDQFPGKEFSDCESVTVMIDPGTELYTREHGSGTYESDELVTVKTENKSILMQKDMAATYSPTTLGLYRGRTVDYSSRWTEEANAKNRVTGASMSEQYRYATFIDRESSFFLDENESVMNIDSEFDGMGHIGFLKMPSNTSTAHDTPTIEVREDYVGSFKILQRVDEYGSSVSYEKAASGSGFAVGDRRVKDSQRSYESGTGTYDSEEIIETSTNYIAKDISLVHAPMSQQLTDDVSISASQKWKEGMYSTTPKVSYIGEEFTSLDYLDKETIAKGLNEMNTQASFEGRARFRALIEPNKTEPEVDFDEQYEGDYSIERRVHFTGIAKYDRPHLNLTKTLEGIVEETLPWEYGEEHLEGAVKKRKVATYTITIENDGNAAFDEVYVKDTFPPGASFIEPSSLRPEKITDTYANWTLQNLPIGSALNIILKLDVTKYAPAELVNRVDACGVYDNETVCARNFSAREINWLTCCLSDDAVSVKKSAELDPTDQNVVRYRIEIANNENVTRVATVTDWLPDGMDFIDSSIDFTSYDGDVIVWNLIEIPPFETKTIEFSVLAPGDGRFTNTVEVDPRSVDGPVVQPVTATCVIDVGVVEDECGSVSCGIWQPPNWELEHFGYESDELTCEDLTCTSCDATESCLAP